MKIAIINGYCKGKAVFSTLSKHTNKERISKYLREQFPHSLLHSTYIEIEIWELKEADPDHDWTECVSCHFGFEAYEASK
jgi:hypothetical protein